jgi:hypothetical protein
LNEESLTWKKEKVKLAFKRQPTSRICFKVMFGCIHLCVYFSMVRSAERTHLHARIRVGYRVLVALLWRLDDKLGT